MPIIKAPKKTYALFFARVSTEVNPDQTKTTVAIGTSNAIPKAKNRTNTKSR